MTPVTRPHRSKLKRIAAAAKTENLEVMQTGDKSKIEGTSYGINDLDTIPSNLANKVKQEKEVEDGIAYQGQGSVLSSFIMTSVELDGTCSKYVEKFYQYTSAIASNNHRRLKKILECTVPRRIKEIGDGVHHDDDWLPNRVSTLYKIPSGKIPIQPLLESLLVRRTCMRLPQTNSVAVVSASSRRNRLKRSGLGKMWLVVFL